MKAVSRFDSDKLDRFRRLQMTRPADQGDIGASLPCGTGDGITHAAGAAVADKAYRIDGFVGRAGRYYQVESLQFT